MFAELLRDDDGIYVYSSSYKESFIHFSADNENDGLNKFSTHIKLHSNGQNIWLAPVLLTSSCKIDVTYFPFDEQVCSLRMPSSRSRPRACVTY